MAWRNLLGCAGLAIGCGPVVSPSGGTSGADSTTVANDDGPVSLDATTAMTTLPPGTSVAVSSDVDSGVMDESGDGPIPDVGWGAECDLWAQDCPPGQKCMPWANDGGSSWNAARCTSIADDPRAVGEPCTVEGSGVSGIDDCELGAMCWDVDPETNMGECVALCKGNEANPTCDDACASCSIDSSGVLILCLPMCDPLAQDCGEGDACYPVNDFFACAPDVSGETGAIGDACAYINVCDPGLFCANPDAVPGCENEGCCAPFCNVDGPDTCDASLPGTTCVPWNEDGAPPDGCLSGTIGACVLPL